MKKLFLILLAGCLMLGGCASNRSSSKENTDAARFRAEYEELNGKMNDSGTQKYLPVTIPADNPIVYIDEKKAVDLLTEGSGVIYFGFPECPWCRSIIETLLDAAAQQHIGVIWYCNNLESRDILVREEDGSLTVQKEATPEYKKILELLGDNADPYDGLGDDAIKRLYFPTVLIVSEGEVLAKHMSSLPGIEDPYKGLDDAQKEELKGIYLEMLEKLKGCSLDSAC